MPRKAPTQMPETEPLFPLPESAPLPKVRAKSADMSGTPKWSRYSALNRLPCDDCKQAQAEGCLHEPARQARWRRIVKGVDRLLCHEHGQHWRHRDGLDIPEAMRRAG